MIIWTGFGYVIAIIGFACLMLMQTAINYIMHDQLYFKNHAWIIMMAMTFAALFTFGFDRFLDKYKNLNQFNSRYKETVIVRDSHSLFFINIKYWPYLYFITGCVILLTKK